MKTRFMKLLRAKNRARSTEDAAAMPDATRGREQNLRLNCSAWTIIVQSRNRLGRENRRRRAAYVAGYIRPAAKVLFKVELKERRMNRRRILVEILAPKRGQENGIPRLTAFAP